MIKIREKIYLIPFISFINTAIICLKFPRKMLATTVNLENKNTCNASNVVY